MAYAEVQCSDGTTIAYDVAGSGPPVLFVHGLTSSRTAWDPVTDLLVDELTCIRIDLRGHGDSSTASDYAMRSLVSDLHAVAEELELRSPAVVGNSLGGTVAAIYAVVHPGRAVVTVDVSLRFGDFAQLIRPFADRLRSSDCTRALLEIESLLGVTWSPGDAFECRVLAFPPEVIRGIWDATLTVAPEELTAQATALLPHISVPLLALHGSPPPPDYERWLTNLVPTAEVEVWAGAGHLLHLTEPERFAARLLEFLDDR